MAKLKGPLMSISATGTVGGIITYTAGKKSNTAKAKKKRKDRPTKAQIDTRRAWQYGWAFWNSMTPAERLDWTTYAALRGLGGHAMFLRHWMLQNSTPTNPPEFPGSRA